MTQFLGNKHDEDFIFVNLSNTQSGNSSTILYQLYWAFRAPTPRDRSLVDASLSIDGATVYSNASPYSINFNNVQITDRNLLLANGPRVVEHNPDGTRSVRIRASVNGWENKVSSIDATYVLPRITRVPSAPGRPTATALATMPEGRVSASWSAPTDSGGLTITGYDVFVNGSLAQSLGNTTSTTVTYTPGTSVSFTVRAKNSKGTGPLSLASTAVIANGNPAANTLSIPTTGTVSSGSVNLSWTAATARSGTIVGYSVFRNGTLVSTVGNQLTLLLNDSTANPDLTPNTSFSFTVAARNQFSTANNTTAAISNSRSATSAGPPTAPTWPASGALQSRSDNATVPFNALRANWLAPSSLGNPSSLLNYTVFWYRFSQPLTVFSATVTGTTFTTPANLAPAADYRFYVRARNGLTEDSDGIGPNSTEQSRQAIAPANWIDNSLSPDVRVGVNYSNSVVASGTAAYEVLSGVLPPGLSLTTSSGLVSGTPTTQGNYSFVIRATITGNPTPITQSFELYVLPGARRRQSTLFVPVNNIRRFSSGAWIEVGTQDVVSGSPRGSNQPIGIYKRVGSTWVSTTIA